MTIKELIVRLLDFDPNQEVVDVNLGEVTFAVVDKNISYPEPLLYLISLPKFEGLAKIPEVKDAKDKA